MKKMIIKNKYLYVSFLLLFISYALPSADLYISSLSEPDLSLRPSAFVYTLEPILFGGVILLLPLCACLPVCCKFKTVDWDKYSVTQKILFSFCSGSISVAAPFIIHILVSNIIAVPINTSLYPSHQMNLYSLLGVLYNKAYGIPVYAVFTVGMIICGGSFSLLAAALFELVQDMRISFIVPYVLYIIWMKVSGFTGGRIVSPVDLFDEGITIPGIFISIGIYSFMIVLCSICMVKKKENLSHRKSHGVLDIVHSDKRSVEKMSETINKTASAKTLIIFFFFATIILLICGKEISSIHNWTNKNGQLSNLEYVFLIMASGGNISLLALDFLLLLCFEKENCEKKEETNLCRHKKYHFALSCICCSILPVVCVTVIAFIVASFVAPLSTSWTVGKAPLKNTIEMLVPKTLSNTFSLLSCVFIAAAVTAVYFAASFGLIKLADSVNQEPIGIIIFVFTLNWTRMSYCNLPKIFLPFQMHTLVDVLNYAGSSSITSKLLQVICYHAGMTLLFTFLIIIIRSKNIIHKTYIGGCK